VATTTIAAAGGEAVGAAAAGAEVVIANVRRQLAHPPGANVGQSRGTMTQTDALTTWMLIF
jgi:hypothetical protein